MRSHRFHLAATIITGTLLWDVVSAFAIENRRLFSEWPLVYGSALLTFAVLYVLHAALAAGVEYFHR